VARASAALGVSSIHIDTREQQCKGAAALLTNFFDTDWAKMVCKFIYYLHTY
jgi:hypothetical protein